jgi:hypothetical protein
MVEVYREGPVSKKVLQVVHPGWIERLQAGGYKAVVACREYLQEELLADELEVVLARDGRWLVIVCYWFELPGSYRMTRAKKLSGE